MYKRTLLLIGLLVVFLPSVAASEEIEATGFGADKKQAIQDALLTAIGKVNGIAVYGKTTVEKEKLVEDTLTQTSFGYVRSYVLVSELSHANGIEVTLTADVVKQPNTIRSEPTSHRLQEPSYDLIDAAQENAQAQQELFQSKYGDRATVLAEGYYFRFKGLEVKEVQPNAVTGAMSP